MHRSIALRWGFLALLLCTLSAAPADTAPAARQPEFKKLQQRLDGLKAQNAQLRQRNAELERHLLDLKARLNQLEMQVKVPAKIMIPPLNPAPLTSPRILPNGHAVPQGWREEQFNGLPYYLIPLQQDAAEKGRIGTR
jgi:hypothetical protein